MRSASTSSELLRAASNCVNEYLCVKPTDNVLITTDTAADRPLIDALMSALSLIDARTSVLTIPQLPLQGSLADPYMPSSVLGAAQRSDVWIDLTFPYIAGSHDHSVAMESKPLRYLLCSDLNTDAMVRLFGACDLNAVTRVMAGMYDFFAGAVGKRIRITTPLGTDVSFQLAAPPLPEPAKVVDPGLYFLPGANTMVPEFGSTRGRVVLESVFHEFYTPLNDLVTVNIDGKIKNFEGGGRHAATLDRVLRRAGGGQDYGDVIHFTHGFHPTARVTGNCFVEDMRAKGSNAVGLGLPFWQPGGGENHPDAVMTRQSIWIEDTQVVREGAMVGDSELARQSEALMPLYR